METIILIHGFCEDSRVWDEVKPKLEQNHRVITMDMPGFGNSSLSLDKQLTTLEDMADLLKNKLGEEGIRKSTVIGHSMGGYLALAFAEKYPELLSGLGLFHSTANSDTDFKKENRLKHIDFVNRNGIEPFVKTLIPSLFSSQHNYDQQIEKSALMAKECSVKGVVNALEAMRQRPDRLNVLKESQVPVLIIAGEDDTVVLKKHLAYQASLPQRCQFELLQNSGHMGMLEEPERSVEAIKEFMSFVEL